MYFDTFSQAMHMDGHGVYVWTVFAVSLLVVAGMLLLPRRREKSVLKEVAGDMRRKRARDQEL